MYLETKSGRSAHVKEFLGVCIGGLLVGGLPGLLLGRLVLGAVLGLGVGLCLGAAHLRAVATGQVYDQRLSWSGSDAPSLPRNHVICIDGTWNHPGVPTNVWKCFDYLWPQEEKVREKCGEAQDGTVQISKYYRGVGSRENIGAAYDFHKKRHSKTKFAGVTGYGVQSILEQAYFDFLKDYREGDRIFLFGFSRGAAIARMLANYISKSHGLPASDPPDGLPAARRRDSGARRRALRPEKRQGAR